MRASVGLLRILAIVHAALACQGNAVAPVAGARPGVPVREPLPCFADEGKAAGGAIGLQLAPSRVSGVAPLSVYFDTLGTTAEATSRPFHELSYCWDFGDEQAGAFATTGLSKNQAKGPVTAHVFETPGTYTVTVSARDAEGRVASRAVEITVEDPDQVFAGEATVCFSGSGSFAGCPAGARQVTAASLGALSQHIATGKRLLLGRGESFTGSSLEVNVPGPGMIGAYGSGDRPRVSAGGSFYISDKEPRFSDWRIADLDLVGGGGDEALVWLQGKGTHLLLLRVRAIGFGNGVVGAGDLIDYLIESGYTDQDIFDLLTLEDCEISKLRGGDGHNLGFITARRLMILGSTWQDSTGGEHVLRLPWVDRGVLSSNLMGGAPSGKHVMKLHAPTFDSGGIGKGRYSENIVISDNVFEGDGGQQWTVVVGPENGNFDQRVRNVIIERNLFSSGPTVTVALQVSGQDVTIRDNIFDRGSQGGSAIDVDKIGIEPVPMRIAVLNNTCHSTSTSALVTFNERETVATVYNNLVSGRGSVADGSASLTEGGNVATQSPGFVKATPMAWADFALDATSAAVDTGDASHYSAWDYSGRPRPVDGNGDGTREPDVGALEFTP
jgi:PKD repeat protein